MEVMVSMQELIAYIELRKEILKKEHSDLEVRWVKLGDKEDSLARYLSTKASDKLAKIFELNMLLDYITNGKVGN